MNLIVSDSWLGSATLPDIVMARWTRRGSDFSDVDYSGSGLFADHGAFAGRYSVGPLRLPGAVTDLKVYCAKKNARVRRRGRRGWGWRARAGSIAPMGFRCGAIGSMRYSWSFRPSPLITSQWTQVI